MEPGNRDEIARMLAGLVEDLMGEGGLPPQARFSGYAIIAGPGGIPTVVRVSPGETPSLSCELAEGEEKLFITLALPPGHGEPSVTLQPLRAGITLGGETSVVDLPCRVDVRSSSWQVRNGVLDICCRKA